MDHEVDDPLGGPLDRELETLLAVEPSAEFLARVRTRVANETIGRRWRMLPRAWSFQPLLAVGIAAIVLAVVIPAWWRPEAPAIGQPPAASTSALLPGPEVVRREPDRAKEIAGVRRQPDRVARPGEADAPPFAEVLFSDDERRALLQLVTAVGEGRVPPFPAAPAVDEDVLSEGPAMTIEPLVIEPLPQIARLEE